MTFFSSPDVPKRAAPPRPPTKPKPGLCRQVRPEKTESPASRKVVAFKAVENDDEDEDIAELKKQVRHAMAVLEEGKPVAAFNLLKRLVGD
jgi:hypothetical protein